MKDIAGKRPEEIQSLPRGRARNVSRSFRARFAKKKTKNIVKRRYQLQTGLFNISLTHAGCPLFRQKLTDDKENASSDPSDSRVIQK